MEVLIAASITGIVAIVVMYMGNRNQKKMLETQIADQGRQQAASLAFERDRQFRQDKARYYASFNDSVTKILAHYLPDGAWKDNGSPGERDTKLRERERLKTMSEALGKFYDSVEMLRLIAPDDVITTLGDVQVRVVHLVTKGVDPEKHKSFFDEIIGFHKKFVDAARRDLGIDGLSGPQGE